MCQAQLQPLRVTRWTRQIPVLQCSGSQLRVLLPPRDIWQWLEIVLFVTPGVGYYWHLVCRSWGVFAWDRPPHAHKWIITSPFKMSVALVEWQAGASSQGSFQARPKNLPGAFSRSGATKRNSRNDNSKPFLLQMTSQNKRHPSSCLSYFITGLGWPENAIPPSRVQNHSGLMRIYGPTERDGFFLLNQIK